jgi:rhodanese-related sulfurtransferase
VPAKRERGSFVARNRKACAPAHRVRSVRTHPPREGAADAAARVVLCSTLMQPLVGAILVIGFIASILFFYAVGEAISRRAREKVARGALLLDVQRARDFERAHIDGALNIPLEQLRARAAELGPPRPVVLYCKNGIRALRAKPILRRLGFSDVMNIGPMSTW